MENAIGQIIRRNTQVKECTRCGGLGFTGIWEQGSDRIDQGYDIFEERIVMPWTAKRCPFCTIWQSEVYEWETFIILEND